MKTKYFCRKGLCLILALLLIASIPIFALAYDDETSDNKLALGCNEAVFRFWDYFTDYETDDYSPPDYFGGFALSENKLIVYVTENSKEVRSEVAYICKKTDLIFETTKYSFNYLMDAMFRLDEIACKEDLPIVGMTLDLPNNAVNVIIKYEEAEKAEEIATVFSGDSSIESDVFSFQIEDVKQEVPPEPENENRHEDADQSRATYSFYPGRQTSFGTNQIGTVGFCAYDSLGRYLMITHSHGYDFSSNDFYNSGAKNVTVAGLTMNAYTLSLTSNIYDTLYDAAYIVIPTTASYSVSNKVNNTTTRIQYVALDTQLLSYSGSNAEAYGSVGGFKTTTITVTYTASNYYLTIGTTFYQGDSGGPVYMTSNSQNRLIGIIQTQLGGGILWKNIRDRYYSVTGQTLAPYLSNT